ncbi:cytochrome P450, partial [Streptomyces sp. SID5785]|nr:cytochrome P450 [Streptomyces sp. SID5785]
FGGGPHECPGQDIGRAIADIGVDAFLMRLPDAELSVDESELRWRSTILSQHLVALPVGFTPRPQQDVVSVPSMSPPQRADWQVSSPNAGGPAVPGAAVPPQPGPAPAAPTAPQGVAPQQERLGAWQRFLRWWRGY